MEAQKILIDPEMEDRDIWNLYFSQKTLKRKYLSINGVKTPIELSENTLKLIHEKKKQSVKNCFYRYLQNNREKYNAIYREKYHTLKKQQKEISI